MKDNIGKLSVARPSGESTARTEHCTGLIACPNSNMRRWLTGMKLANATSTLLGEMKLVCT